MENEQNLTAEEELEDLLYELFELDFDEDEAIQEVEADIYPFLQKNPNNICALIVLMFVEIMHGNRYKAQSLAYKIWEIGGELPSFFEMIYIENLLSLGMIDMAMVLLKPRFEHLASNIEDFYSVLLKFSVMTGNVGLLRRIEGFPNASEDEPLFDFADNFARNNKSDVFKNIQRIILENQGENICAYEYKLTADNPAKLEIELYLNAEEARCTVLQQQVNQKIKAYLLSVNETNFDPIKVIITNIKKHEAWLPEEDTSSPEPEI